MSIRGGKLKTCRHGASEETEGTELILNFGYTNDVMAYIPSLRVLKEEGRCRGLSTDCA